MAKYCSKCGRPADEDAAFCQACGAAFTQTPGMGNQATGGAPQPPSPVWPPQHPVNRNTGSSQKKLLIGIAAGGGALILGLVVVVAILLGRGKAGQNLAPPSTGPMSHDHSSSMPMAITPPVSIPQQAGFWDLVASGQAQAYDVYTTYDTTVKRDLGRVVMAPGWKMYRDAYWEFQSVAEPVTIQSVLASEDGQAGIISRSGARFIEVQNGGALNLPDADSALGFPRRARMTPQQLLQEFIPLTYEGISDLSITSYELVDDNGRLLDAFKLRLAEEIQSVEAAGNRVENIYCEYGVARGTVMVDGQLREFEAYIELEGYDGAIRTSAGEARLGIFGMSGFTMLFAPPGSLAEYIPDMALILYNSQLNSYWIDLRNQVSEYLLAQVNNGGLAQWVDAWLYADEAIAAAGAGVPDARDYTSYRKERIDLDGIMLGSWEPELERYRYISADDDVFILGKPWAGAWYDGGTSLIVCALPDHIPDEAEEGYLRLEPEA